MRKRAEGGIGGMLPLPSLSLTAAEFLESHPEVARVAIGAALEAVAAQFDSLNRGQSQAPASAPSFIVETVDLDDDELIGVDEAAGRLEVSRATVRNWIDSQHLLGWRLAGRDALIPAEQILGPRELVPGIDRVLQVLGERRAAWRFLTEESPFFDTPQRPIDVLKAGRVREVVAAAQTFGETWS